MEQERTKTIFKYTYENVDGKTSRKIFNYYAKYPCVAIYSPEGEFLCYTNNTQTDIKEVVRHHRAGTLRNWLDKGEI